MATAERVSNAPVITSIAERRACIMANTPGLFVLAPSPDAKPYPRPVYAMEGFEEVTINAATIEHLAARYGLDPDFVKAIAWMESTHGWYDRLDPHNETIRPMNVHETLWAQLGIDRKILEDRKLNVAAGVHILAAIRKRTQDPTPEKVATLYNALGATEVSRYGKTVDYYRTDKPWLRVGMVNTFRLPCSACHER